MRCLVLPHHSLDENLRSSFALDSMRNHAKKEAPEEEAALMRASGYVQLVSFKINDKHFIQNIAWGHQTILQMWQFWLISRTLFHYYFLPLNLKLNNALEASAETRFSMHET